MNSLLEKKRIEAELAKVKAARLEMEFRLVELKCAQERIEKDIEIQLEKEKELEEKIKNL